MIRRRFFWVVILLVGSHLAVLSGQGTDGYQKPPAPIDRILSVGPTPAVSVSPDRAFLMVEESAGMPSIEEITAPTVRVAGLQINAKTGGPHAGRKVKKATIRPLAGGETKELAIPKGGLITGSSWSPDCEHLAYVVEADGRLDLWVMTRSTGECRRLIEGELSASIGAAYDWMPDGRSLVAKIIPKNRGAAPIAGQTPTGPVVQESDGKPKPTWTGTNLLKNAADEALFEYYGTSIIVRIGLDGQRTILGEPGIHFGASPSPDGRYLLLATVHRPYSYRVDLSSFPRTVAVLSIEKNEKKTIAELPLQEIPLGSHWSPIGPRSVGWMAGASARLIWAEALDGGDPKKEVEKRDALMSWSAPFDGEPRRILATEFRIGGRGGAVTTIKDNLCALTESWGPTRRTRRWLFDPTEETPKMRLMYEGSSQDRYSDPGDFMMTMRGGDPVAVTSADGRYAYLSGAGASAEGERPFIDKIDLATGETTRLWRSEAPYFEQPVAMLDRDGLKFITRRESTDQPPNLYVRDLVAKSAAALTDFADPAPEFAGVRPEIITYRRADGVMLSAKLYLPKGYKREDGPLPFLFWAYPLEFKDAAAAAQIKGSPYRFTRPSMASPDHLYLLTQGYGILDDPTMPIIGEGKTEPNDTYLEQLVSSAEAAVEKVVSMGVCDRNRIAVGGHSYGAFMTANLLAHSNLFRTGIARSGAYNRTLTPFGFQGEARNFWQATETYEKMSPFFVADRIDEPILLIHGEADSNTGTYPIQTERLFGALKGLGGRARYIVLPGEDHGYRARQSVEHVLWEMTAWMDRYVKSAAPRQTPVAALDRAKATVPPGKSSGEQPASIGASGAEKKGMSRDEKASKVRGILRRLEIARAKLDQARFDGETAAMTSRRALENAEIDLKLAATSLEQFQKVEMPTKIAQAELQLRGSHDRAEEAAEELKQIEIMYKEQDLQEMTAEFVVKRGKRSAERAAQMLEIEKRNFESLKTHEMPKRLRQLELEVDAKKAALEKARRDMESGATGRKIALMAAESEIAGLEEELVALEREAGK